jgi:hypothetical protein
MSDHVEDARYVDGRLGPLYTMTYRPGPAARPWNRVYAVLICPPIGDEWNNSCRALVNLARRLAGAGVTACRVDYHGTGDSSLDFVDRDVESYVASIDDAAVALRAGCGVDALAVLGVRAGALFAALFAEGRPGADALILVDAIDPPPAYVKELACGAAVAGMRGGPGPRPAAGDTVVVRGFSFPRALLDGLARSRPSLPAELPVYALSSDPKASHDGATGLGGHRRPWSRNDVYRSRAMEDRVLQALYDLDDHHAPTDLDAV